MAADYEHTSFLPIDVTETRVVEAIPSVRGKEWLQRLLAQYAQIYRCWPENSRKATEEDWEEAMDMWNAWRLSTKNPYERLPAKDRKEFHARKYSITKDIKSNGGSKDMMAQVEELVRDRKEELARLQNEALEAAGT